MKQPMNFKPGIPDTITAEWLLDHNACEDKAAIFRKEWPNGAALSRGNIFRACELSLSLNWFAEVVLTDAAWAEFEKAVDAAWAEYEMVSAIVLVNAIYAAEQTK